MATVNIDEVSGIRVERDGIDLLRVVTDREDKVIGTIKIGYEAFPELAFAVQDAMHRVTFIQDKMDAKDFNALAIPGDPESAERFELRAKIVEEIHRICTKVASGSISMADLDHAIQNTSIPLQLRNSRVNH